MGICYNKVKGGVSLMIKVEDLRDILSNETEYVIRVYEIDSEVTFIYSWLGDLWKYHNFDVVNIKVEGFRLCEYGDNPIAYLYIEVTRKE